MRPLSWHRSPSSIGSKVCRRRKGPPHNSGGGSVVTGIKDSGGDREHTAALIAAHSDIAVLVGYEGHIARAVSLGASGAISSIANLAPAMVARLASGEHARASTRSCHPCSVCRSFRPSRRSMPTSEESGASFGRPSFPWITRLRSVYAFARCYRRCSLM
ncbi:MAG: hypothetical protein GY798_30065 [Hyphomicrobiales bacterium]|nr:hypothetical protein [Hyphomicrobiales bacterium]